MYCACNLFYLKKYRSLINASVDAHKHKIVLVGVVEKECQSDIISESSKVTCRSKVVLRLSMSY